MTTTHEPSAATDPPGARAGRDARRALVESREAPALDGIDFVEVLANRADARDHVPDAPRRRTLAVHLLRGPVAEGLGTGPGDPHVMITGGVRADPVRVEWAYPATAVVGASEQDGPPPGVTRGDRALVAAAIPEASRPRVLVVRTSTGGDDSAYVLRLLGPATAEFDEPLTRVSFRFAVDGPATVDCRPPAAADPPPPAGSPLPDYLARDYQALRTRLLDRMAVLLPAWADRSPADIGVTLLELFAYLGDRLAYRQDAIAGEAYLGTARRRTSVRRHARLIDYRVHEGCAARTWLAFATGTTVLLPAGTAVTDASAAAGSAVDPAAEQLPDGEPVVFETCAPIRLTPARNRLDLHAWGDPGHHLPAGATSAFVRVPPGVEPGLRAGDVVVLAESDPAADLTADPLAGLTAADPTRRYAVRLNADPVPHTDRLSACPSVLELRWHTDDALPGPLRVSRPGPAGTEVTAVALANVVLADHGLTTHADLDPPRVPPHGDYRPQLPHTGLAWADPTGPVPVDGSGGTAGWESATAALRPDPTRAVAQVTLHDGVRAWSPRTDLLNSGPAAPVFVVEPEPEGWTGLRFGGRPGGLRPHPGTAFAARYRLGGGTRGNVGVDVLRRLRQAPGAGSGPPMAVTNPLPAAGGTDPQPLAEVRELAPYAIGRQLRAVTSADHAACAVEDRAVRRAVARRRWVGSWYVEQVTVQPVPAAAADRAVLARVARRLETRRMAGVDVALAPVVTVPLDIRLVCCLAPGQPWSATERQVRETLTARLLPDGGRGPLHPENLSVTRTLFLSDLVAAAMSVPAVTSVRVERFGRRGAGDAEMLAAIARGRLDADGGEVLRCGSTPDAPDGGCLDVVLRGGS
ncbi:hypothetical protein ABZ793_22985 [Micromonospora sp. NPDC047465]|uniref:hypothetical protein n=1 Tax=Micromonospora sp. NPDC047465 TaxID=3154813 RepID=UPI0033FE20B6